MTAQVQEYKNEFYDDMIRLNAMADGSCLFHSILLTYSTKYNHLTDEKRGEYVERLRKNFGSNITKDTWISIGKGDVSKNDFFMELRIVMDNIYKTVIDKEENEYIEENEELKELIEENKKILQFILDKLPRDVIDNKIIPESYSKGDVYFCGSNFVRLIKKYFKKCFKKYLNEQDETKFVTLLDKTGSFFEQVSQYTIDKTFKNFITKFADPNEWMSMEYIPLIADTFDINIYFFNDETKTPYITGLDTRLYNPDRKSIILLWSDNSHFDALGVMEDGRVKTTFDFDDEIIVKIHTIVTNAI